MQVHCHLKRDLTITDSVVTLFSERPRPPGIYLPTRYFARDSFALLLMCFKSDNHLY